MSNGDLWEMPGGHRALEVSGTTEQVLMLSVIDPSWPFSKPPIEVARVLCKRLPMRYYKNQVPQMPDVGDAPF